MILDSLEASWLRGAADATLRLFKKESYLLPRNEFLHPELSKQPFS